MKMKAAWQSRWRRAIRAGPVLLKPRCAKARPGAGNFLAGLLAVLLIWALSGAVAHAGDGGVYIYTNAPWPPRIIYDEKSANLSGIDIEIVREIAEAAGFEVHFTTTPWKRSLRMMALGTADITSSCQRKPDREKYMHFLEPPYIANSTKAFYLLRGEESRIRRYEDIYGLTVGVNLKYRYSPKFDNDRRVAKHSVKKDEQLIRMLLYNRIDAFIGTEMIIDYLLIKGGHDRRILRAPFAFSEPAASHIVISKKSGLAKKLPVLQRTMKKMVEEGAIDRIIRDYFAALKDGNDPGGEGVPARRSEKTVP